MNNTPKNDFDVKTLYLIENILEQEKLLFNKYQTYASIFYDSEFKNICYRASKKHKSNYNTILSYLRTSDELKKI